jgi:pimeloyl-ACP methyl ester carboxylesterase
MPMIQADDGVRLYAESTGSGTPMLFIHEFADDHRSWEPHTANLEDPAAFNREVDRFLAAVDRGAWRRRDPRSLSASTTGMTT